MRFFHSTRLIFWGGGLYDATTNKFFHLMKNYIFGAVFAFCMLASPIFASAAGLTSSQIQSILTLLSAFGADSVTIANVQTALNGGTPATGSTQSWCYTFNKNLSVGQSGLDVVALQTILGKSGLLPGMTGRTDGNFDDVIASAVTAFQEKYASDILTPNNLHHGTGYVGAATRAKLNVLFGCQNNQQSTQPSSSAMSSVTVLSPNGGENYVAGNIIAVKWTSKNVPATDIANVSIVRVDGQYAGATVDNQASANVTSGIFNYTIPATFPAGQYNIAVYSCPPPTAHGNEDVCATGDYSDAPFTITN